jgi:hypothetical protein
MDLPRPRDYARTMKIEDVRPGHCYARAQRLLAETALIRDEMGRTRDPRPIPEVTDARPREVYFEAAATWAKADRLAGEIGVATVRFAHVPPVLRELRPGDVLQLVDAVLGQLAAIKQRLQIAESATEPALDLARQPSDVLVILIQANRELSRMLERPFTPSDVYRIVSLASAYAARLGGNAELAPFERGRKPADCYERLGACHTRLAALIARRGETALTARGTPGDVVPGDVYDLASLVLGEVAFLHSLVPIAAPLHAFEPTTSGHRLPAHVDQLARTLEAQLAALG